MDRQKYIMLKATMPNRMEITLGNIKDEFDVDGDEALEMMNNLAMEGMVEVLPYDGTHFRVIK